MGRWEAALRFIGVGWFIAISILLGVWGGIWLDEKLGTSPIMVIVGLILGLVVAFYGVYRMLLPLMRDRRNKGDS
jgi:F0F1-type ATP synthase assembly protein I